jgi:uncharacterized protein (DUF2336 family)
MKLNRQIDYLYELSRQRDSEGREDLYLCVADLFSRHQSRLSERERQLMKDILWSLTREVEMAVRRELAESLAANPDAPQDLLAVLLDDRIEVARPILMRSQVLKNADLIEIVRHRTQAYQLAVAARSHLDPQLCDILVETGDTDVIVCLLGNSGARLSEETMARLAEASKDIPAFQQPLLERRDLPPEIARRMCAWVSAALRQFVASRYEVDVDDLDDALSAAVTRLAEERRIRERETPNALLVNALAEAGGLNEALVLRALHLGQVGIFEEALAVMFGLDLRLVQQMLYDPGWENLAIACRALEFSTGSFCTIQGATAATRRIDDYADMATDTPCRFYDSLNAGDSMGVLRRWRRDSDFTDAVAAFSNL